MLRLLPNLRSLYVRHYREFWAILFGLIAVVAIGCALYLHIGPSHQDDTGIIALGGGAINHGYQMIPYINKSRDNDQDSRIWDLSEGDRQNLALLFDFIALVFGGLGVLVAYRSKSNTAEAVYQRGQIANDEIRYREASAHARRAAQLAPQEARYLRGAGELAEILGDYQAAKDYHEQALVSDLDTLGEGHPGSAWHELGEYRKAIGYLEQALAICERRIGIEHPHTRIARKNLANARAEQAAAGGGP